MTGSIKDGSIAPGGTIVEATSGNTGISFSAIGRALGHPVTWSPRLTGALWVYS